jgi:hypothetical protein
MCRDFSTSVVKLEELENLTHSKVKYFVLSKSWIFLVLEIICGHVYEGILRLLFQRHRMHLERICKDSGNPKFNFSPHFTDLLRTHMHMVIRRVSRTIEFIHSVVTIAQ